MVIDKTQQRVSLINAVKTPLGFFVFTGLGLETACTVLLSTNAIENKPLLFGIMLTIALVLISLVALIAVFQPEALWGKRNILLLKNFAESLGKDIFNTLGDYLVNEQAVRAQAYEKLEITITSSQYYLSKETGPFAKVFIDTISGAAELTTVLEKA